jgi:hypothetical protein
MPPVLLAAQPAAGSPDPFAGLERFTGHAAGGSVAVGLVLLAAALLAGWAARYDRDPPAAAIAPVLGYAGGAFLAGGAIFAAAPGPANFDAVGRVAHWAAYAGIGIAVTVLTRRVCLSRRSGARSWH